MRCTKVLLVTFIVVETVSSSAIPMWEFLTANEKVVYLFNMFQLQVGEFCKTDVCKQDLKNYGWRKLKAMSEEDLDEMDPFQRNSSEIIWETVMKGHEVMKTASTTSTSPKTSSFEDFLESDTNVEASAKIETVEKAPPQIIVGSGSPEYKNRNDQKITYSSYSSNKIQESTTTENLPLYESYGPYTRAPLQGVWAVKVHPDGSPVTGDPQIIPEDDDLRLYQMTKVLL